MILLLSCVQNSWKWPHIQENWLHPSKIPYVILVGNPNLPRSSYTYDASSHILQLGCADNYDEIVHKIAYGISAVVELFDPLYIFKIDDDVVINVQLLHTFMQSNPTLFDDVDIHHRIQERSGQTMFGRISNNIPENDVGVCRNIVNEEDTEIFKEDSKCEWMEFGGILYGGGVVNIHKTNMSSFGCDKFVFPKNKTPIKIHLVVYCGGPIYYLKNPPLTYYLN